MPFGAPTTSRFFTTIPLYWWIELSKGESETDKKRENQPETGFYSDSNIHIERKTKKKECTTVSVNDSEIWFLYRFAKLRIDRFTTGQKREHSG